VKRILVMVGCVTFLGLLAALAQPAKEARTFTVRWYGQAFFTVDTPSGKTIAFDPQVMREFERKDPVRADFVCVTHPHNDHDRVEEAIADAKDAKKVTVFRGMTSDPSKPNKPAEWAKLDEKVKVGDGTFRFRTFGNYHDAEDGKKRGKNVAFVVEADGLTFCHLGDLGHTMTAAEAKAIGPVDVLFVPVGGVYTVNAEVAKEVVEALKPRRYVFPMHYAVDGQPDSLLSADEYLDGLKLLKKRTDGNDFKFDATEKVEAAPTTVILGWKPAGK
jgi:L-ascorbate metabolism protein UlaG (beta-lactamase superfamily)